MIDSSRLKNFGINPEDVVRYDILCLPERFNSELRDTTDSIELSRLLKRENIECANSYDLGLDAKVYERRGIDLWLGTIYILKVSSIPLLMGIIGRLIGAKVEGIFINKQEKIVDKIHADLNIKDGKINAGINFDGDSETFLKILKSISEKTITLTIDNAKNDIITWNNLIVDSRVDDAIDLCEASIKTYKEFYKNLSEDNHEFFKTVLILAILFKGLQEFSSLLDFIRSDDWHENTNRVEYYWYQLWDSKDRLNYIKSYCKSPIVDSVIREIERIENYFDDVFGKGFYSSPEIIIDKFICNICDTDTRGCLHTEGNIYGNKICRHKAVNPRIEAVSIVEKPRDPRCRIWSWNWKGDNRLETMILAAFTPDNFLHE